MPRPSYHIARVRAKRPSVVSQAVGGLKNITNNLTQADRVTSSHKYITKTRKVRIKSGKRKGSFKTITTKRKVPVANRSRSEGIRAGLGIGGTSKANPIDELRRMLR